MNIRGIEYYDIIDYRGGVNTSASTYLEWMATVRNINSPYKGDNGLHVIEYYATYNTFNGNNIWINYELSMNHNETDCWVSPYAQINPSYLFGSKITNGRFLTYNDGYEEEESYRMLYYDGSGYERAYNLSDSFYIFNYPNCLNNGFYKYNVHIYGNNIDFYVNGSYYIRKQFVSKYFTFACNDGSRGRTMNNENHYIKWITLTDKMSNEIPQPPYGLNEKDDNMYGIQKE